MSDRDAHQDVGFKPLLTGLRLATLLVIALVAGFCSLIYVGVHRLDTQVNRWSYLEKLDDTRERLVSEARLHIGKDHVPPATQVLEVFDQAGALVRQLKQVGSNDPFSKQAEESLKMAKRLFIQTNFQRAKAKTSIREMSAQLAMLQQYVNAWDKTLRMQRAFISTQLKQNTDAQSSGSDAESVLIRNILQTEATQRRLSSLQRFETTSPDDLLRTARSIFSVDSFPEDCSPEDRRDSKRYCAPSSARVLMAYDNLRKATFSDATRAIRTLDTALGAYSRANALEYRRLMNNRSALIENMRNLRSELKHLDSLESISSRIDSILRELEATLRNAVVQTETLDTSLKIVDVKISGLKSRMITFIRLTESTEIGMPEVIQATNKFRTGWARMDSELKERDRIFLEFESEMGALANVITRTVNSVRSQTGLWVNVFASVSLLAAFLLGLTLLATLWGVRSFVLLPMSQVTRAVHHLANGDLYQQIHLSRDAFGYAPLRKALLRLSSAMKEREALSERIAEQKTQIERNMREMEQTHKEMQWLALHDPLTKLPNRRHADKDLVELSASAVDKGTDFSLIHLDVDRFKQVNDTLGHEAGDFILRHVASTLQARCSEKVRCYRIGGDEFLITVKNAPTKEQVSELAAEIVAELSCPIEYQGHICRTGASLGIAFGKDAGFDAATALVNADLALYETKRNGRSGFRFFANELLESTKRHKAMGDRLLAAIEAEDFVPFYQPQFYSDGLRLRGIETLCRWHVDELGWVPPAEFLDIAEDMKLIAKIDQILLSRAAKDMRYLRSKGLIVPQISFNITADRLTKIDLASDLLDAIGPETKVALELLESMSLDTLSDSVRWSIDLLKEHGVAIEIDDFGSCRASVAGLIAVGPDAMKIDGSLIKPMTETDQHLDLVRAIIEIGRALEIEVVGEGVESQTHIDMLRELGCDVLQGYALAMPMPVRELEMHLQLWRGTVGRSEYSSEVQLGY